MTSQRRHDLLAVALLLLLPTLFFRDVLFGQSDLYLRDLARFHYPMKTILREVVRGGEFPYWNRYFAGGQPLAANPQHEVFYPPNWLVFLPDYNLGFRLQILLHIYIAAIGMYALLRSMRLSARAATFGAISFSMGGLYLSLVNVLPFLYSAAWIPLTCLFTRRFLIERRARHLALASLFLAIQLVIGEPTTILQTGMILGIYALHRAWHSDRRGQAAAQNVGLVALVCVAAMCLAAVQVLPTIDHARDSIRGEGFRFELVSAWSLPLARAGELVFPNLLGHTWVNGMMWYWGAEFYPGTGSPFLLNIYCGLAVIALAMAGIFTRLRGWVMVTVIFVVAISLATGARTPLLRALYDAGIVTSVRFPEKFIMAGVFSLIVFAAYVLDRILQGDRRLREAAAGFALAAGMVATTISVMAHTGFVIDGFLATWHLPANAGTLILAARAMSDWNLAAIRAVALLVLLLTIDMRRRAVWTAAALLFLCVDLGVVVEELTPTMPRSFFTEVPPLVNALPKNRAEFRIFHNAEWDYRSGPRSYWLARNGLFPPISAQYGLSTVMERDFDKTHLKPTAEFERAAADIRESRRPGVFAALMAMSNAWYRTVYNNYDEELRRTGGDITKVAPIAFQEVVKQPRYYFADQIIRADDRAAFARKIVTERFTQSVAFIPGDAFVPARGLVHAVHETANDATIDAESFGRGFLVMSVTPHKYWNVTLDGHRVEPVITNVGYQGIEIPAGRHRVEMRYRNRLFPIGLLVSILTAAGLAILAASHRPRIVESTQ